MENQDNEKNQQFPNEISENEIENSFIDDTPVNLQEEMESDEEELLPPEEEKNEAKEINIGTILGIIFLFLIVILMFVMFATSGKKKKKANEKELDKVGTKFEYEFKEKTGNENKATQEIVEEKFGKEEEEEPLDVDKILDELPSELQITTAQPKAGTAPVYAAGSTSYTSSRPDTRNSKSPRKVDGIKGQAPADTNQTILSSVMNGTYTASNQRMSKEEYIAQMMAQTKSIQDEYYGGNNNNALSNSTTAAYQQNKEEFYANGYGTGGSGQFMSFNSLWDGTIISGALVTAINTDNPGVVIARVTENVYSSYDHSFLLIPEGSLLYATYNSSVSYGQNKVQVAWNLLVRPDGYRVSLGNMNGVNAQGVSGYKGAVNNHPFETLKALGLVAVYSILQTEVSNDIKATNNEYLQNSMTDVYKEVDKLGNKMIDRALDIKPTITIKAGTEIKLITNIPLELPPVEISPATKKYVRTR